MSNYKILVKSVSYNSNGTISIQGIKLGTQQGISINCSAEQLCTSILKPNNSTNKKPTRKTLFKLTDIPSAMRAKGWDMAAYLNEKWLNDESLEMTAAEKGDWSNIKPSLILYKPNIFNHKWLENFKRYNDAIDDIKTNITSKASQKLILKYLKKDGAFKSSNLKGLSYSSESNYRDLKSINPENVNELKQLQTFHKNWQCQKLPIDDGLNDKLATYISNGFKIDDLWSTFGSFAIYACVGDYKVIPQRNNYFMIYIETIVCYAIDSYEFITPPDDYLGHWSRDEFEFNLIFKKDINNLNTYRNPKTEELRGSFNPNNLLYPVYNSHYQEYRKKYKKGRDMVVWTKPKIISMEDMSNEFKTFIITKSDINSSL